MCRMTSEEYDTFALDDVNTLYHPAAENEEVRNDIPLRVSARVCPSRYVA